MSQSPQNQLSTLPATANYIPKRKGSYSHFFKDRYLYLMVCIPVLFYFVFKYYPMYGIVIAFQDYNMFKGFFGSEWVGLDVFRELFRMKQFWSALGNTLMLSLLDLAVGFPGPIVLAILLNELRTGLFKKISQSLLYLPHFLSWIIISGMLYQILSVKYGLVNHILEWSGIGTIPFLTDPNWWIFTYVASGVWQNIGWGAIIYLAAMAGINSELYEAASVDGAKRFRLIWHVTLPCIRPTIVILFILTIGNILNVGFERVFALSNSLVSENSEVIATFVYQVGIQNAQFSLATAIGLFQSTVALVLLVISNFLAKKLGEDGIW
ncbi:ABC transporter permease [Paenibacillus koleovorans]|uniref:ABC transporter permease n=1 Tax=Paenibacillus koleovorans TaxID=121608 RepID=UPI000FD79041|nr:ABC transporter permease subunit [Paenibacillus koleovorans]